jgi:hypothetical protein
VKKHKPSKLNVSVVGLEYRVTTTTLREMEEALPLKCYLTREPMNRYDPNAIKVVVHPDNEYRADNFHIGYLRRTVAELFAPLMDEGTLDVLECRLVELDAHLNEGELTLLVSSENELRLDP